MSLNPVMYNYDPAYANYRSMQYPNQRVGGFIAQQMLVSIPEAVRVRDGSTIYHTKDYIPFSQTTTVVEVSETVPIEVTTEVNHTELELVNDTWVNVTTLVNRTQYIDIPGHYPEDDVPLVVDELHELTVSRVIAYLTAAVQTLATRLEATEAELALMKRRTAA